MDRIGKGKITDFGEDKMKKINVEIVIDEAKINANEFTNDIQNHCEAWGVETIVIGYS